MSFRLFPNPRIIFAFNMPLNLTPTVVFQLKITHKLNIKHEKQKKLKLLISPGYDLHPSLKVRCSSSETLRWLFTIPVMAKHCFHAVNILPRAYPSCLIYEIPLIVRVLLTLKVDVVSCAECNLILKNNNN